MRFADRLRARDRVLGMLNFSGSADMVELLAVAGYDFVIIDTEHTPYGLEHSTTLVRSAQSYGIVPLIRVYENNPSLIMKALDCGAEGVIVPHVNNSEDMQRALRAAWFPPYGTRGMCPNVRAARYDMNTWLEYAKDVRSRISIIPLIEEGIAVDNIEDIIAVEGVNAVLFGYADYATSTLDVVRTGFTDEVRAQVSRALKRICDAAKKKKISVLGSPPLYKYTEPTRALASAFRDLLDMGVTAIVSGADTSVFHQITQDIVGAFKLAKVQ